MGHLDKDSYSVFKTKYPLESLKLVQPLTKFHRLGRIIGSTLVFVLVAISILPWQQTAPGIGRVVAFSPNEREQTIHAPVDGRIVQWHVMEGSRVKIGDPIVDLSDNDPEILKRLDQEKTALTRRLNAAKSAREVANLNLDRQKALFEQGLSSQRAYEVSNLEYQRALVDEANATAEMARFEVRLSRQLTQSITSPVNGVIFRVTAGQGAQIVKAGEIVARIVPETDSRAIELWVSGNDLPLIWEGRKARVQIEGWPALQFTGWPSVAVGTFGGIVRLIDASDNGLGRFRVIIVPDPEDPWPDGIYLRQGVRAQGWVLLNQVRLGYELWRRFNGFPPAVSLEDLPYQQGSDNNSAQQKGK
jgi:multidrug efflux pump subunit AcrA (membrane-fusion protein)